MLELLTLIVFPGLVILAACTDVFTMTIPNRLSLALVAAFFIAASFAGLSLETIGWHIVASLVALLITFGLFAAGVFGGGDAKLTAAVVLWMGPQLGFDFALLAALLGGFVTLGLMLARVFSSRVNFLPQAPWLARLLSKDVGIPYGIALSAAAIYIYAQSPWFQMALTL